MAEQNTTHGSGLHLDVRPDDIAVITLDTPGERYNILKHETITHTEQLLDELAQRQDLQGLVFISGKADSFIAGADIHMIADCDNAEAARDLAQRGQQVFARIAAFPVPVVAAIHGVCLGGGLEMSLACQGRICSDDPATGLGLPEVMLGLLPGAGGTQRLPRLVGVPAALDMMLTGRQIRPAQARRMGLVDETVPVKILLAAAVKRIHALRSDGPDRRHSWQQWLLDGNPLGRHLVTHQASKKAAAKTQGNYPAPERIIHCVERGLALGLERGLALEAEAFGELSQTPEARALLHLYFASTRLKKDNGVDANVTPLPVHRLGVLGAGLMGAGISFVSSHKAELPVRLKDTASAGLNRGMAYIHRRLQDRRRRMSDYAWTRAWQRITPTLDYSGFQRLDVVIEAVFEDLDLKHQMVQAVEQHCPPHTIFATNTSSLPITQIAEGASRPERVVGMHYFSPVEKMPLLEVITTAHTTPEVTATATALGRRQGKTVIVVQDGAGFYVNRILAPYINEAGHLLAEGITIDAIDRALTEFGFPVGPFALLDEVGIDVAAKVGPILVDAFGERMQAPALMDKMLADGRQGRKTGRGFYRYPTKGAKSVDSTVYELLGVSPSTDSLATAAIIERCVLPMINEAVRCLDEGIIRSSHDGDIGAVYGIGFPPFRGGPFHWGDRLGVAPMLERLNTLEARHGSRFSPAEGIRQRAEAGHTLSRLV